MKLSKLSIPYRAVKTAGSMTALGVFTGIETVSTSITYGLMVLALFFGFSVLMFSWFYLVWKNFSFEITSDTFDIRSGVVRKKVREIPLHRIQNVDVRRSIFQRILGIAQVNLETAGGETSEASLKFVDFNQAKQIQKKVRELKQEEAEDSDDVEDDSPIFSISEKELGILSATSMDWTAISVIFIGLSVFGGISSSLEGALGLAGLAIAIPLILGLALVSFMLSAASTVNKYYDFKLYSRGDSLEYERGLLNRSEGSIPFEKIQNLRIEENPLKRLFGYATLKVETAGYSGQTQEEQGPEIAVPLAERSRVDELSNMIFEHGGYNIQGVSEKAFRRYFVRYSIGLALFLAAIIGVVSIVFDKRLFLEILALIPPVAGTAAYLTYVNRGFYEGKGFFYTMNGFWNRKTTITPYYRIQNLTLSQTIFQKRLNTSTLILDTAGIYAFASNPKAVDLDEELGENLFERVFKSFKESSKK